MRQRRTGEEEEWRRTKEQRGTEERGAERETGREERNMYQHLSHINKGFVLEE